MDRISLAVELQGSVVAEDCVIGHFCRKQIGIDWTVFGFNTWGHNDIQSSADAQDTSLLLVMSKKGFAGPLIR